MKKGGLLSFLQKISLRDKIFFTKNLSVMIKSGLSLSFALNVLAKQTSNKKFKNILIDIKSEVEKGNTLTKSLAKYPKIFPEVFINMTEAGEKSGKLVESLEQLTIQMKKNDELVSKIKGALIYPLFILGSMVLIGVFMFIFVIPKMLEIFSEINAQLPLLTRILIKMGNFSSNYGVFVLILLAVLIILLIKFYKTQQGKEIFDKVVLKLPIASGIIKKITLAKFCRTFSSLLLTDIPIVQTLSITANVVGNNCYKKEIEAASMEVTKGNAIAKLLERQPKLFPPLLTQMIQVGEETGTLDNILDDLTAFYEQDVKDTLDNLTSLIEPILIIILGIAVGGLAAALILPMYSLTESF